MSAVGSLLGLGGGAGGTGFASPKAANIISPVTKEQAQASYDANQAALAQQQQFVNQLLAQQGLQKQADVYGQFANIAAGQGPNPAQAMLANATGANVANQAALMAGQRGSAQNAGLMARQAANAGAGIQQNAAGQAALMQAQQSLGALGQMGGMANQMAGQAQQGVTGMTAAQQAEQQALLNSIAGQNTANVQMQSNINQANAALAAERMKQQGQGLGGLMNAAGAVSGLGGLKDVATAFLPAKAEGGMISERPMLANGGPAASGPQSMIGQLLARQPMAEGGKVPALVSPGEKYLSPQAVQQVKQGANPMHVGETIPGKPKVDGAVNSYANDTVKKTLDEGGIVLPRSVTKSENPEKKADAFVKAILAKHGQLPKRK